MLKIQLQGGKMATTNLPATFFNDNFAVRDGDLEKVLDAALGKKADYADLYFEYRRNEGVSLEEGLVKNCSQSTANGVGVRVLADTKTGYAYYR
jgi:TldD protein